jgi:hypothetical protein
MHWCHLHPTIR